MSKLCVIQSSYGPSYYVDNFGGEETNQVLPGVYELVFAAFAPPKLTMDKSFFNEEYVYGPEDIFHTLDKELNTFVTSKAFYEKSGIAHKRGYLLYGPPGTGKSAIAKSLGRNWVNRGGIVITLSSVDDVHQSVAVIQTIFRFAKSRPIMFFGDEIDDFIDCMSDSAAAWFFDGSWIQKTDSAVFIGTTNNFEQMDMKFTNRPGRFDRRLLIEDLNVKTKLMILTKLGVSEENAMTILRKAPKASPSLLTEIVCRHELGQSLDEAIKTTLADFPFPDR